MAVNDEIMNNLAQYGEGSINERIYNFLGNLGYTGTLNDRLAQYSSEGRKGWQGLLEDLGIWTPAQLFSQGDQGLFFVPKPVLFGSQALYQDSAGTTLTDANGDPVGLGLEWSRGLVLGPELVSNGTFDTDLSGWNASSGWVWDSGVARDESTSNAGLGQVLSYTTGAWHVIELDIDEIVGGSPSVQWPAGTVLQSYGSNGHKRLIIKAPSSIGSELVFIGGGATFTVDNITVRQLPGNHLTQNVSADRPTYNTDGALHWLGFDGVSDYTFIVAKGATSHAFDHVSDQWSFFAAITPKKVGGLSSSWTTGNSLLNLRTYGTINRVLISVGFSSGKLVSYREANDAGSESTHSFTNGEKVVIGIVCNAAGETRIYVNGVEDSVTTGNTVESPTGGEQTFFALGARATDGGDAANFFDGEIQGAVFTDAEIDAQDASKVSKYLADLAGITL